MNTSAFGVLANLVSRRTALSIKELASLTGISTSSLYSFAARGAIKHYRLGGAVKFDPADVVAWMERNQVGA